MIKENTLNEKKRHFKSYIKILNIFYSKSFISVFSIKKKLKNDEDWKKVLTPEQFNILRREGTEKPFSSILNNEYRDGDYVCVACNTKLFHSSKKYDSGTGWPSFFDYYKGSIETKIDYRLIYPRVEYRCAVCEGHHGHVFNDGPKPTFKRYCNNGKVLKFIPSV